MAAMPHESDVIGQVKQPAHRFIGPGEDHRIVEIKQKNDAGDEPVKQPGSPFFGPRPAHLHFGWNIQADDRSYEPNDYKTPMKGMGSNM